MKKHTFLFVAIYLLCTLGVYSQIQLNIWGNVDEKTRIGGVKIAAGEEIELIDLRANLQEFNILGSYKGKPLTITEKDLDNITFVEPAHQIELWNQIKIRSVSYRDFLTRGFQYDIRHDLEEESLMLLQHLDQYYGFFEDDYLQDYVQSLVYKIHSITLDDKRPGNISVKILRNTEPNAFMLPNGTLVVNTGLLTQTINEDELLGVLAHEVAHFVLDHQVANYNAEITDRKEPSFGQV